MKFLVRYSRRTILFAALILAVSFFFLLGLYDCVFNLEYIPPDALSYVDASDLLFEEQKPDYIRPIGYAFILGLIHLVIDQPQLEHYVVFSTLINVLFWLGSIVLFSKTCNLYFSKRVSYWLAIISVFSLGSLANVFLVLPESISTFLLAAVSYLVLKYHKSKSVVLLIIAASLLNLLMLFKPGFMYLGILGTIGVLIAVAFKARKWHNAFLLLTISVVFVVVQLFMMNKEYGTPKISFIDKITWYYYLGAEAHAAKLDVPIEEAKKARATGLANMDLLEQDAFFADDLRYQLSTNSWHVFQEWFLNLVSNTDDGSHGIKHAKGKQKNNVAFHKAIAGFLFFISKVQNIMHVLLLFVCGFLVIKRRFKVGQGLIVLIVISAYVITTSGISFWQGDRFHVIVYQMILLASALLLKDTAVGRKWLA